MFQVGFLENEVDHLVTRDRYVYELAMGFDDHSPLSPLHGHVFYVGKGSGNRIEQHEREVRTLLSGGRRRKGRRTTTDLDPKHKMILWVLDMGGVILKNKVASHLTDAQAFALEKERIDIYGLEYLTNIAHPHKRKPPA